MNKETNVHIGHTILAGAVCHSSRPNCNLTISKVSLLCLEANLVIEDLCTLVSDLLVGKCQHISQLS